MSLTPRQLAVFELFGFIRLPGFFDANEVEKLRQGHERVFKNNPHLNLRYVKGGGYRRGVLHDGSARTALQPLIDQDEYLSALIDEPRIEGIAAQVLGEDFNYMNSDGNYYVGSTSWHSDEDWHNCAIRSMKFMIYLDPLRKDSGAMRVIPGTHRRGDSFAEGVQDKIYELAEDDVDKMNCHAWDMLGPDVPCHVVETDPGDLVIFNPLLKHSSWGGHPWRRLIAFVVTERWPDDMLDALRDRIGHMAYCWQEEYYGSAMRGTAGPGRMRHLEQIMANESHLPELVRQHRKDFAHEMVAGVEPVKR